MKKEIHRKKVVNVNDRQNKANKACVKMPSTVKPVKKKVDLKKEIPAIILLILFIFWSVGSVFGFIAYKRSKAGTIVTNADTFEQEYLNPADYYNANYFNPYAVKYNGVAYVTKSTLRDVYISAPVVSYGYVSVNYLIDGFDVGDVVRVKGGWYIDSVPNPGNGAIRVQWIEPNAVAVGAPILSITTSNSTVTHIGTITAQPTATAKLCLSLYYTYSEPIPVQRTIRYFNIMVGRNTDRFIPNLEAIYEQGKEEARAKYDLGYLNGATFSGQYMDISGFTYSFEGIPIENNGSEIVFNNLYQTLKSKGATTLNSLYIKFGSAVYGERLKLVATGNSSVFMQDSDTYKTFTLTDTNGGRYTGRWYYEEELEQYGLQGYNAPLNVYYNGIESWNVGALSNLLTLKLSVPDTSYNVGFDDGYNLGLRDNKDLSKFYQDGYNSGYVTGYNTGKNDGITMTNTYTFERLLTAVFDVPIKAFMGLTNFEILGVNLSGFYLSLLTACAVLVVVKLLI